MVCRKEEFMSSEQLCVFYSLEHEEGEGMFVEELFEAIKHSGLSVATIIGGAPVSKEFAEKTKADCYGADALDAVSLVRRFIPKTVTAA